MTTTPRGRRAAIACVAAVASLAAACSSGDTTVEPVGDPVADETPATPSWLFTQTSTGGTFTTDADGTHTLTLTGVDPSVTAFTDRPDREAAVISTEQFVREWPSMFADSAPNAVLVEHEPSGTSGSFVVTLFDPELDDSTVTFTAEIVDAEDRTDQPAGVAATPHGEPPASFTTVSLFIDNVDTYLSTGDCSAPPGPGVNWTRCDLYDHNLSGVNLSHATLSSVDMGSANLSHANLSGADMTHANLSYANLQYADLSGANLSYADLEYADLKGANLTGANLTGVRWFSTICPDNGRQARNEPCPV